MSISDGSLKFLKLPLADPNHFSKGMCAQALAKEFATRVTLLDQTVLQLVHCLGMASIKATTTTSTLITNQVDLVRLFPFCYPRLSTCFLNSTWLALASQLLNP